MQEMRNACAEILMPAAGPPGAMVAWLEIAPFTASTKAGPRSSGERVCYRRRMARDTPAPTLATLHRGFRSSYLSYAELSAQLEAWANAYPELCQLDSLGETPEGRSQWILTIGPDPRRIRPAAWVDGNLHAIEFAGSSVA